MKKLIIITNIPDSYRFIFFQELSKKINLQVIYLKSTSHDRVLENNIQNFNFNYIFLDQKNQNIFNILKNENPTDILLMGYDSINKLKVFIYSIIYNRKLIMMSDSNFYNEKNKPLLKKILKKIYLFPFILKSKFAIMGTMNDLYWSYYGVKNHQKFNVPFSIEQNIFKKREIIQNKDINFFFIGRFVSQKNILFLIKSFHSLLLQYKNIKLHLIGDGILKEEIQKYIKKYQLEKQIHLYGFLTREKIHHITKKLDIFILPSLNEPWGLVVNEMMQQGHPIIVSKNVGSGQDLVKNNINGFIYDNQLNNDLFQKMEFFIHNKNKIKEMSLESINLIKDYTIDNKIKFLLKIIN